MRAVRIWIAKSSPGDRLGTGRYPLEPKAFIAYDRIALFGREDPDLRITFDCNLRWRDAFLDLSQGGWGQPS